MKTIGLLGGMSWESTAVYYRLINQATRERLGPLHSAPLVMVSVDFAEIEALQQKDDWTACAEILVRHAQTVERAGADVLVIGTNTMHKCAGDVLAAIDIPLLHIADATADRLLDAGVSRVGLLGTRFTMVEDFYRARLEARGLSVVVPAGDDVGIVHRIIIDELCQGVIRDASRDAYVAIIDTLVAGGAEAVIAGCTEIGLLVSSDDSPVPVFDTAAIHAEAAVDWAIDAC